MKLKQALQQNRPLIFDGATGTALQAMGLPLGQAPERWNLTHPQAIKQHHRAYIEAGAEAILTNTFGGNRLRLTVAGLAEQLQAINQTAAQLAKEVAGDDVLVLGSIGPMGLPAGTLKAVEMRPYFYEQAVALAAGGVDALHIETMYDIVEAQAAIEAARQACDLPLTVTMTFDTALTTMTPREAAQQLWSYDEVIAIGINCGRSMVENLAAIIAMHEAVPEAVLIAKPNAGLPRLADNGSRVIYDLTPTMMAEYALKFMQNHVKIIGGCCGTTPAHIRSIKTVLSASWLTM